MNPKYPVYIISKGRWESRLTSRTLEDLNVPYRIVVEDGEYDKYASVISPEKVLPLPTDFREKYKHEEDEIGQGSIPVRNFVWEHSKAEGAGRHWILDDNIRHFYRLGYNLKVRVTSGTIFRCCEDFTDRYENVPMSGMQYAFFRPRSIKSPPYYLNTRVYSCILLDNNIPHRWRGRYNEDTDLSLRILKDGYCTILFNAFLCGKAATLSMKGGNTEEVYNLGKEEFDNRLKFAQSLKKQHPDVVEITQKWGRYHHHVDYRGFQRDNKLVKKDSLNIPKRVNNYGMKLVEIDEKALERSAEIFKRA